MRAGAGGLASQVRWLARAGFELGLCWTGLGLELGKDLERWRWPLRDKCRAGLEVDGYIWVWFEAGP